MKNILVLLLFISCSTLYAQQVENKYNFYLSFTSGNFLGSKTINNQGYITPSLYNNYSRLFGYSFKGIINTKSIISYGVNFSQMFADRWNLPNYSDFRKAKTMQTSVSPLLRLRSKRADHGLFNRLVFYTDAGLNLGFSNTKFTYSDIALEPKEDNTPYVSKENLIFTGWQASLGLDFSFNQEVGLFATYTYSYNSQNSKVTSDTSFTSTLLNVGLLFKFGKSKKLYF